MVQQVPQSGLSGNFSFRNLIINGDFQIWQRGTSAATVTGTASYGTYRADRFAVWENTDGTITQEQEALSNADVITTGMRNALLVKCTGTDSSIGADQFSAITHKVEAQNCQGLQYGTSNAKNLTLSFFVKSNITGTHNIALRKEDSTAYYLPKEYTINSADTWEKKTITFGSDDTNFNLIQASGGNIVNDNGTGVFLHWGLANGSNLQGTANTWTSSVVVGTSNQQNFLSSTSNEFYLTGVQLEVGDTASDFEHLPHDVQLQRCFRYYYKKGPDSDGAEGYFPFGIGAVPINDRCICHVMFPVEMRDGAASLETTGTATNYIIYEGSNSIKVCDTVPTISNGTNHGARITFNRGTNTGLTVGNAGENLANGGSGQGSGSTFLAFDVEL
jgi:hypothetical protein